MDNLVEYGLGPFTGKDKKVTVAEPLALMGIFHYFINPASLWMPKFTTTHL
jgi:hypothetical protein